MDKNKKRLTAAILGAVILILLAIFGKMFHTASVRKLPQREIAKEQSEEVYIAEESEKVLEKATPAPSEKPTEKSDVPINPEQNPEKKTEEEHTAYPKDAPQTEEEPEKAELTCTLSVNCATILDNMASFDAQKAGIIPSGGIIYPAQTVTFNEGETVFNLLVREMKRNKIHLEFEKTPVYNSAYIEGIANIYELDCGELSGWMYRVNGEFPNYGCSQYTLKAGDKVEWVYTCNLGKDVGGAYAARNGR